MTHAPDAPDLRDLINEFFAKTFSTDNRLITEAIRRMLAAGGKRIRPRVALLAAQAVGGRVEEHLAIASYIELIHVATLIHDDVVDNAQSRRGVNATAVDFGNQISVLAGDYLFAWIFKNVTADYPAPVPHILSSTLAAICDGEVLQLKSLGDVAFGRARYLEILEKKTASLFVAAARCGSILGGGTEAECAALAEYGRTIGTAFQIIDDILDMTASAQELGKPVGHDFIEGKVTLPLILTLETASPADVEAARAFYRGDRRDPHAVLALIEAADGIALAQRCADELIDAGIATLEALPPERRGPLRELARTLSARSLV